MILHIWTVPCRLSTIDRESNNVSLIEVMEEITIPTIIPQQRMRALIPAIFDVVTLWARQHEDQAVEAQGRTTVISPNGEELLHLPYQIQLQETRRFRSTGRIFGFPMQESGRYHFRTQWRLTEADPWQEAASVPFWVQVQQTAARNAGPEAAVQPAETA